MSFYRLNLGNHTFGEWLGLTLVIFAIIIFIKKGLPALIKRFSKPAIPTPFEIEREKIVAALKYINEWDDMPTSWLLPEFCKIMEIKQNNAADSLLREMCMPNFDIDKCTERIVKLRTIKINNHV